MKTYTITEFAKLVGRTKGMVSRAYKEKKLLLAAKNEAERYEKIIDCQQNRDVFSGKPGPKKKIESKS